MTKPIRRSASVALALLAFFSSVPSLAQDAISPELATSATPTAAADPQTANAFNVRVEWKVGPAAWAPVGNVTYTVKEARNVDLDIKFRGEAFHVLFNIQSVPVSTNGGSTIDAWQIGVTRQDFVHRTPVSRLISSDLALVRGEPGIRLVTYGKYRGARYIRLTFSFAD